MGIPGGSEGFKRRLAYSVTVIILNTKALEYKANLNIKIFVTALLCVLSDESLFM